ncbi:MAG TPA: hypothetical protein VFV19_01150 [Candidatus Polarisedimenticolaceae bacterium]|nr:hypothetical protein [Candidatus Polarisedimenticolaceae bacterium]
MPTFCEHRRAHGVAYCPADCAALTTGVFERLRLGPGEVLPPAELGVLDVAILDMNHGWPNVGHEGVFSAFQDAACAIAPALVQAGLRVRAISFDVRRSLRMPAPGDDRFEIFVGTGGPGHLDPRLNDGRDTRSQGVAEDPAWEAPLFRLFDAIVSRPDAALLSVCHTFGLMCRWLGVADAVARGDEKGGKSEGVRENLLTDGARAHPLFAAFARQLPAGGRLKVLDSRLYDLIPRHDAGRSVTVVGTETLGIGGPPGEAMTMMEVARDASSRMPRVFGVNHHPEIIDRANLMGMLRRKLDRGEIDREWYDRRVGALAVQFPDEKDDPRLQTTTDFTFLGPLRFHLTRTARRRAESLGRPFPASENDVDRELTAAGTSPA